MNNRVIKVSNQAFTYVTYTNKASKQFNYFYFTENATRFCHINGQWDNYTNYDLCHHVVESSPRNEFDTLVEVPIFIYITGYIISLIALIISVVIFTKFK